jgi:hypothetical protein
VPADCVRPCFDNALDFTFGRSVLLHYGSHSTPAARLKRFSAYVISCRHLRHAPINLMNLRMRPVLTTAMWSIRPLTSSGGSSSRERGPIEVPLQYCSRLIGSWSPERRRR